MSSKKSILEQVQEHNFKWATDAFDKAILDGCIRTKEGRDELAYECYVDRPEQYQMLNFGKIISNNMTFDELMKLKKND